ncbi:MAG: SusC/RagA family TonB-linked outer membrane protein [Bacteroidales bacterium]|jgi:TonB-linked SusC/RagA family outer membrane protein|nr:SusC/RagA family TonB-linked outer membrane protein [Bacteroidales bacterium]
MKFLSIFLFVMMFQVTARSQDVQFSFSIERKSLKEALRIIEKSSPYHFLYNDDFVDLEQTVSVQVENGSIEQILDLIFNRTDIRYRVLENNLIVITPVGLTQQKSIGGRITGADGAPLPGVNVVVKGTSTGTVSDANGYYTIRTSDDQAVLTFSFVGHVSKDIPVSGKQTIDLVMEEDAQLIEEVVVVGYGTQRKKDLTSSVVSLKSDDFNKGAIGVNPLQLVEGKIAGLTITRNNGNDPNAGLGIQLRGVSTAEGVTSPLIVIDGVAGGDLQTLSPHDIASMDILKDGSAAAIYGTRGTNGVILITTKQGQAGVARVDFDAMVFTEIIAKRIESLSSDQYWQYSQDHQKKIVDLGYDTDWFNELVKIPVSHAYNLSLSGGTEKFTYRASASYKNQDGIVAVPTTRETINGRISLSQRQWDNKLRFDLNLAYSNINAEYTSYSAFEQAVIRNPTWPVRNQDNTFYYAPTSSDLDFNPVAYLYNHINGAEYQKFMGDFRITLEIIPGLKANVMTALHKNMELTHYYEPSTSEQNAIAQIKGQAQRATNNNTDRTLEALLDYSGFAGKHRYSVMAGYSYQDFMAEGYSARNMNFTSDDYLWNNMSTGSYLKEGKATMSSSKSSHKLIAFFGRALYNYDDRYLLTASVRKEGSSRFGKNSKWGMFPAVSAGWRVGNEAFMQDIQWLSDLKIRAGYGVTGNQMGSSYISIARMSSQGYVWHDGQYILSYGPSSNPNPDLKWEVKHETNFGFDAAAFDNRIGMTFDIYRRNNSDLLYEVKAAVPSLIHNNVWANVGNMTSNGVEVVLFGEPVRSENVKWHVSANLSYNKSRLVSLSNDQYVSAAKHLEFGYQGAPGILGNTIRLEEGGEVGNFFGFHYLGLTPEGKWIFENLDDDPTISTEKDQRVIGNGVPKFFAGLTSNVTCGRFDFSLSLKGAFKFDILNVKEIYYANPYTFPSNNLMLSALTKHKDIRDSPQYSDYYLEKGDYVKISNLTVAYRFNTGAIEPYVGSLKLFVSADNLYTFTGYSGIDPELTSSGFTTGIDPRSFYPRTRMFTLGLNASF